MFGISRVGASGLIAAVAAIFAIVLAPATVLAADEISFSASAGTPPTVASPFQVGQYPTGVATGRLNGDQNPDFVVSNSGSANVSVGLGDGSGSLLSNPIAWLGPGAASSVATGDFNEDGQSDLAVSSGTQFTGTVSLLFGNGGTFGGLTSVEMEANTSDVAVADLNPGTDSHDDLVAVNANASSVSVRLGAGDGTLGARSSVAIPIRADSPGLPAPSGLAVADFDRDGNPDVAVTSEGYHWFTVFYGDGSGGLVTPINRVTGIASFPRDLAAADLNGSGSPDLVVANSELDSVSVIRSTRTVTSP